MLAKLFFLLAVILFVLIAMGTADINIAWPLASVAAGLLVEGFPIRI